MSLRPGVLPLQWLSRATADGWIASPTQAVEERQLQPASLDLRLSDEWQFQYIGAFEGITRRLTFDRVSVTRVFCDCMAVSLTYLGAQQEIWLEAWLTAIPWGRGRIGIGGRGQLLFDQPIPFLQQP